MSISEKLKVIIEHVGRKPFNRYIINQTQKYQKKYGFEIGVGKHATWNNEADAFKHAYMQWFLSYYLGNEKAKKLGDMHEDETPNAPLGERNMDLWNNQIGREISSEMKHSKEYELFGDNEGWVADRAARKIMEKMQNGEMITSPNDRRKFENMELELLQDKDRVYYKGEFSSQKERCADNVLSNYLEQAINNNWEIPEKENLEKRVLSGELIYVNDYVKSNGQRVSGYYRRRPVD